MGLVPSASDQEYINRALSAYYKDAAATAVEFAFGAEVVEYRDLRYVVIEAGPVGVHEDGTTWGASVITYRITNAGQLKRMRRLPPGFWAGWLQNNKSNKEEKA
jgi:hypothetical protein